MPRPHSGVFLWGMSCCGLVFLSLFLHISFFFAYFANVISKNQMNHSLSSSLRLWLLQVFLLLGVCSVEAQQADYSKLSPRLRLMLVDRQKPHAVKSLLKSSLRQRERHVCAFIRLTPDGGDVLEANRCRSLARFGDIHIADIPVSSLPALSLDRRVKRIEAGRGTHALMDSTAMHINTLPVYAGTALPQPYTGNGVVMGVMDIGFDLTHPTFYDSSCSRYRIRRLWDQISPDTIGSPLYVGREYTTEEELLALGHSYDGLIQTHGTHTAGIAAGSGYDSPYRGMAYESDLCLVANATTNDKELIDSADYEKYNYAVDALGFKYIFDYAESIGRPCVINFSEGSLEDFEGNDQLYYAILDSLTGPGRILVASAGNSAQELNYMHKPVGRESAGIFIGSNTDAAYVTLKSAQTFDMRFVLYSSLSTDTLVLSSSRYQQADSIYCDSIYVGEHPYYFYVVPYPSCFNADEICYDVYMQTMGRFGRTHEVSLEVVGSDADVELYKVAGGLEVHSRNPDLCDADNTHCIHSPSSAPSVICVGATSYRTWFTNYKGEKQFYNQGTNGRRGNYSSVGPTFDGRIKPDVMAPGTNIVSAYSSFYIEHNPDAGDLNSDVSHFPFRGRTYAWNSNAGTSMSAPVVAGAIALWLEANPHLSPSDVLSVISRTSTHYDPSLTYPNNLYGYGQIDVYAGLLDILGISAIREVSATPTEARIGVDADGMLRVSLPQAAQSPLTLHLYSLDGRRLASFTMEQGAVEGRFPVDGLSRGVYAVQLSGDRRLAGSALVRLP